MIAFGRLDGVTVAITGASRGIGKETAVLLGRLGANLMLGARDTQAVVSLASAIGPNAEAAHLDVTDERSVTSFAEQAFSRFGRIDALINSAGTGVFDALTSLSANDFDRMIAVNLKGTFLCCKAFGIHMAHNKSGKIVNVVSIAGTTALPGCGGYSASKFGVLGLTRVLQAELRDKGVYVTALLPGAVATSFWDGMEQTPDRAKMIPAQALASHICYLLCQPEGAVVDEMTVMPPLGIL